MTKTLLVTGWHGATQTLWRSALHRQREKETKSTKLDQENRSEDILSEWLECLYGVSPNQPCQVCSCVKEIEVLSSCKLRGYTSRVFCIVWIHSIRLVLLFQAPGIVKVHVDCIISLTRSSTFFVNSLLHERIASSFPLIIGFLVVFL